MRTTEQVRRRIQLQQEGMANNSAMPQVTLAGQLDRPFYLEGHLLVPSIEALQQWVNENEGWLRSQNTQATIIPEAAAVLAEVYLLPPSGGVWLHVNWPQGALWICGRARTDPRVETIFVYQMGLEKPQTVWLPQILYTLLKDKETWLAESQNNPW